MKLKDIKNLPKYRVLWCLLDETISPEEAMWAFNIFTHTVPLDSQVVAFVYYSRKGRYHIFVSSWLSLKARQEVFFHEIYHIIEDMPRVGYVLGLDMQRKPFEKAADMFVREIAALRAVE